MTAPHILQFLSIWGTGKFDGMGSLENLMACADPAQLKYVVPTDRPRGFTKLASVCLTISQSRKHVPWSIMVAGNPCNGHIIP